MYNWSTSISRLHKNKDAFTQWRLEQQINFGLNGKRLNTSQLKKYFNRLKIDSYKRDFIKYILHG